MKTKITITLKNSIYVTQFTFSRILDVGFMPPNTYIRIDGLEFQVQDCYCYFDLVTDIYHITYKSSFEDRILLKIAEHLQYQPWICEYRSIEND